jgi:DNA polymerase III epsilon subunit-like protein
MTRPVLILDTETTGLFPEFGHQIWEVGIAEYGTGREHLWRIEPDLFRADAEALEVNRYHERTSGMAGTLPGLQDLAGSDGVPDYWSEPAAVALGLTQWLKGVTIVGANPAFDALHMAAFLREHGYAPPWPWHYRLRDIGSMAYGWLSRSPVAATVPPIDASTDDFAHALGVDTDSFERHSALGDCRLVAAMLGVIEGTAR